MSEPSSHPDDPAAEEVKDVQQTTCCVVGGGPAGMILSLLLARKGVPVTLLEAHKDFDRDFRGDTVHPSTLEIMDQLGLAERLLQLPHGRIHGMTVITPRSSMVLVDLRGLRTKFPFIMMVPQARFLDFLSEEAKKYPSFRLELGANVQRLVREDGTVRGVRYRGSDNEWHEVRATLTVAADGRFSKIRSLVGFEPVRQTPPMDVLWFRLPSRPDDKQEEGALYVAGGKFVVVFQRADTWQIGYVILKGSFAQTKTAGIDTLRRGLAELVPWLADRVDQLQDFHQITTLSVESSRLPRWHLPGLLLIGDAAHVMSPVGGVGINYAIQDAVEAANMLAPALKKGAVSEEELAAVQKRREWPVKVIQKVQGFIQDNIVRSALDPVNPFHVPWMIKLMMALPILKNLPGRMIGFGVRKVRVEE